MRIAPIGRIAFQDDGVDNVILFATVILNLFQDPPETSTIPTPQKNDRFPLLKDPEMRIAPIGRIAFQDDGVDNVILFATVILNLFQDPPETSTIPTP